MFSEIFEEIINFIFENDSGDISEAKKYLKEMFIYNVIGGKQLRPNFLINSLKILSNSVEDMEKMREAHIVGCCIEILQAGLLVHDDIVDSGIIRRNKPCWHLVAKDRGFGLMAVNDGLYLIATINKILKKYFVSKPYYLKLIDLFTDTLNYTCTGQCLDILSSETINWNNFTSARYEEIIKLKTAYYTFNLPVACAMALNGETDEMVFRSAEQVALKIGKYFQIQDDYLDFYGDEKVIGKVGRDIEDGKCSWLIIQALKLANDSQKLKLKENYGKDNKENVKIVRKIYRELELDKVFEDYEREVYNEIVQMVDEMSQGGEKKLPRELFISLLNKIHKRVK